jgi:REP element-mobilizing transposase RayT
VIYRGFPERLHHKVPHWVEPDALFHIRVAVDRPKSQRTLTDPLLGQAILDSAKFYEAKMRWHITLFLLMPDHLHALLSFARDTSMSEVIKDWKRFHKRTNNVMWQEGYFDHRLRADERGTQLSAKLNYIRQNPVAADLCARAEDWPWIIDQFAGEREVDRLLLKTIANPIAEGARCQAAKPQLFCQRVEDNVFHLGAKGGSASPKTISPKAQ